MKNLFLLAASFLMIGFAAPEAAAQVAVQPVPVVTPNTKDTSKNTNTVSVSYTKIPSRVKAFQTSVSKLSGTVGGKVYLQTRIDANWITLDSMVLVDQAVNTKLFTITSTVGADYRANYVSTAGTQTSILSFSYLRRSDE